MTMACPHRRRRAVAAATLAPVLVGAAACGDEGSRDNASPTESTTTAAEEGGDRTVTVTAADYRFDDLPANVAPGSKLGLRNESAGELHELVALRLADDEGRSADQLVKLPELELRSLFAGPPSLVLVAPPREEGLAAVGDGALGAPGRYLVMCFIPTGADPAAYLDALRANPGQPPSVPGGPPHFTSGMYAELTVR